MRFRVENRRGMPEQTLIPIDRAKQNIHKLNVQIGEFLKLDPCRLVVQRDADTEGGIQPLMLALQVKKPIPSAIPSLVREIVKNLWDSLNADIIAKVRQQGGNTEGLSFPYANMPHDFMGAPEQRALIGRTEGNATFGRKLVKFMSSLEPYYAGKGANLASLGQLNVRLQSSPEKPLLGFGIFSNAAIIRNDYPIPLSDAERGPHYNGAKLKSPLPEEHCEVNDDVQAKIDIAILNGLPFKGSPVAHTLSDLATEVSRILDGLRAL